MLTLDEAVKTMSNHFRLSLRQAELVKLFAEGLSSKEAAVRLGIDPRTAAEHLARTCAKMGVADRGQVTARLLETVLRLANGADSAAANDDPRLSRPPAGAGGMGGGHAW